jgi:hypothetical protein
MSRNNEITTIVARLSFAQIKIDTLNFLKKLTSLTSDIFLKIELIKNFYFCSLEKKRVLIPKNFIFIFHVVTFLKF